MDIISSRRIVPLLIFFTFFSFGNAFACVNCFELTETVLEYPILWLRLPVDVDDEMQEEIGKLSPVPDKMGHLIYIILILLAATIIVVVPLLLAGFY
ncbi:MAG: hypothetical protein ACREAE_07175 [Nitrosopumilaceae archaeon]